MASGYYPAGAEFDSRAPYNEPDEHIFDDKAEEIIEEELETIDYHYIEWLEEKVINQSFEDENLEEIASALSKVKSIRELYREHRFDDIVEDLFCQSYYDD